MSNPRGFRMVRAVAALSATLVLGVLAVGPVRADTKAELDAAKASLASLEAKITSEDATITSLESQASDIAAKMDRIQSRIARTLQSIDGLEQDIRRTTDQLVGTQSTLDHRAWVAYENGPGSNLEFLLGSTSLSDLTDRLEIVNRVAQTDADLIQQIHDQQNLLAAKEASLKDLQAQLQATQVDLAAQQKALQGKLDSAQKTLDSLNKDKAAADTLVKKLGAQYAAELAAIEAQKKQGEGAIGGVLLACPVRGAVAYSDDFGAPRYGGGYHLHAGNDMFAAYGTPIVAPFAGTVTQDGNDLGGLAVVVTGSDGYVYNAHLSAYEGFYPRSVGTGDVIGYVGNSGDAQGGSPHDHFEWHPNVIPSNLWKSPYGVSIVGSAIDPFPYLNSVC